MRTYQLKTELWLPEPRDRVFPFFSDPKNLERLTPPWLRFKILTPEPIQISSGALLDYRLRLHGWPIHWQSEITDWEPPVRFVDRQTQGPYRLWVHEHRFGEKNGGTVVGDAVTYAVTGGFLVYKFLVAPDLEKIFHYRHEVLRNLFNAGPHAPAG
jgi:ligand-binding SRPBCC domain-containing protein